MIATPNRKHIIGDFPALDAAMETVILLAKRMHEDGVDSAGMAILIDEFADVLREACGLRPRHREVPNA